MLHFVNPQIGWIETSQISRLSQQTTDTGPSLGIYLGSNTVPLMVSGKEAMALGLVVGIIKPKVEEKSPIVTPE
jgi:hypothetical protein